MQDRLNLRTPGEHAQGIAADRQCPSKWNQQLDLAKGPK